MALKDKVKTKFDTDRPGAKVGDVRRFQENSNDNVTAEVVEASGDIVVVTCEYAGAAPDDDTIAADVLEAVDNLGKVS